jgi:hypothetical protein
VKAITSESNPAKVSARAKQAGEAQPGWEWVERTVWTERMLEAQELGYFSLYDAHRALLQPS